MSNHQIGRGVIVTRNPGRPVRRPVPASVGLDQRQRMIDAGLIQPATPAGSCYTMGCTKPARGKFCESCQADVDAFNRENAQADRRAEADGYDQVWGG